MQKLLLAVTAYGAARGEESTGNALAKVLELMDDLTSKVQADGEAAEKAYKEYFEWCDDVDKNTRFEIKTSKAQKEKLTASIEKAKSQIEVSTTKIEELAEAISKDEKELEGATKVRKEEQATFEKAETSSLKVLTPLIAPLASWRERWKRIQPLLHRSTHQTCKRSWQLLAE